MSTNFFKISIEPFQGIIIKICRAYTNTEEDFEDYYQEVCLQIWKSRENFKAQSEWSTWIYRITLNVCMTLVKKKKLVLASIDSIETDHLQAKEIENNQEDIEQLYSAIRQLSEVDRAIIVLYLEEKTYKEIGEILGISITNIGVRVNRIKKRLKKILNGKVN